MSSALTNAVSGSERSRQVVIRLITEVMNRGNVDAVDELLDDAFVNHGGEVGAAPPGVTPKQLFKRVAQDHHETMGDLRVEILESVAEGEDVVVRSILNARHAGTMFGMPPTGNQLRFQVLHMYRVKDGKITDHWECRDEPEMFNQLEALPPALVRRIKKARERSVAPRPASSRIRTDPIGQGREKWAMARLFEGLANCDASAVDDVFAEDADYLGPPPDRRRSREGYRDFIARMNAGLSDLTCDVERLLADGDLVAARVRIRGNNVGEWLALTPSGRPVSFTLLVIAEFHDGQITRYTDARDNLTIWMQVGSLPERLRRFAGDS